MRLQRLLARAGVAESRRKAEALIKAGRVQVNGQVAHIGESVDSATDQVTLDGRTITLPEQVWILLNKPVGFTVTKRDESGRKTVFELLPDIPGLVYVGRLDFMTSGLLLMTNDGEGANLLSHPRYETEREYELYVRGQRPEAVARALRRPPAIDGRPPSISDYSVDNTVDGEGWFRIRLTLTEGRNRIIRRLCEHLGLVIRTLERVRIGSVGLGDLAQGEWRYLSGDEIGALRSEGKNKLQG